MILTITATQVKQFYPANIGTSCLSGQGVGLMYMVSSQSVTLEDNAIFTVAM